MPWAKVACFGKMTCLGREKETGDQLPQGGVSILEWCIPSRMGPERGAYHICAHIGPEGRLIHWGGICGAERIETQTRVYPPPHNLSDTSCILAIPPTTPPPPPSSLHNPPPRSNVLSTFEPSPPPTLGHPLPTYRCSVCCK